MGIKYKVDETFFEKWSSDMAYVLVYIYADGSLNDSPYVRGKYIQITSTEFTSGSKIFLEQMNDCLIEVGIDNAKIYPSKRSYQLVCNTSDSIKIFKSMYKNTGVNSFFMRKFKIFKEYFELRPQIVDATIKVILCSHGKGHVVK